jgi:hypothetical protein
MNRDPQFAIETKKVLEGYAIFRGDQAEAAVHRSITLTPDVKKFITDLLREKYNVKL